jgi:hypothetical protein
VGFKLDLGRFSKDFTFFTVVKGFTFVKGETFSAQPKGETFFNQEESGKKK